MLLSIPQCTGQWLPRQGDPAPDVSGARVAKPESVIRKQLGKKHLFGAWAVGALGGRARVTDGMRT